MSDSGVSIEHQDYYNWLPGIECISVVQEFNFNLGNAIKYIWRAGRKNGDALIDLRKAKLYIEFEIQRREAAICKMYPDIEREWEE